MIQIEKHVVKSDIQFPVTESFSEFSQEMFQ